MVCCIDAFEGLRSFTLISLLNLLEEWHVEDGAMPNCKNLKIVPRRIACVSPYLILLPVPSLESLKEMLCLYCSLLTGLVGI